MKLTFDISATEFATIRDILMDTLPSNCRVWVFGSRAKNIARFNSDLDLALEASQGPALPKDTLPRLKDAFNDAPLSYRVDMLDLREVSDDFQAIIRKQAVAFPLLQTGKVPKLRFPEFLDAGDWEGKRLEDFCEIISGHPVTGDDILETKTPVRLLRGINITEGRIRHSLDIDRFHGSYKNNLHRFILEVGDIVIGMDGSKVGRNVAAINEADAGAFLIQRVARLRRTTTNYLQYAYHHIFSPFFHRYVDRINTSSGIPHISLQQIRDFPISSPHPDEQRKIADFLTPVDVKIAQLQKKKTLLETYKKGCMQKLLAGAEMEWKPLGWVGDVRMCKRVMKSQTSDVGDIPFFKIGTFGKVANSYIPRELFEEFKGKYSYPKIGDILISASGTIGRTVIFDGKEAYFQDSNIVWIENDESKVLNKYLFYFYQVANWHVSDGGVIKRLYNDNIKKTQILLPPLAEQQKIADFLSAIDDKITLTTDQHTYAKTFKKGLLQQMFV